jgi:hypothetical protein
MRRHWKIVRTGGAPCYVRDCTQFAAVPVDDSPTEDLPSALPEADRFNLAVYAESKFAADLALTLGQRAGAVDLGPFGATYKEIKQGRRMAIVQGNIVVADGRTDPAFFGGHARLLQDCRRWEAEELKYMPIQIRRLRELEEAGVDVVEFPTSAAVDLKFARLNLAQPVALCRDRFRIAQITGRVSVKWL